jgi:hypothetical protein
MPRRPVQQDTLTLEQVVDAIRKEMEHQDTKYGKNKPQSFPGFTLLLRKELDESEDGWVKNTEGRDSALAEMTQVAALAIRCLMKYGTEGCPGSTNDVPPAIHF